MGIRRLAAAGAVSGAALLGVAAPATAAAPHPQQDAPRDDPPKDDPGASPDAPGDQPVGPPRISASPNPFQPGQNLTIRVSGCKAEPRATSPNQIFAKGEPTSFDDEGSGVWSAIGGTRADLKPGHTYVSKFTCFTGKGLASMELRTKLPAKPKPPTKPGKPGRPGTPGGKPGKPGFSFGYGDVTLSTRRAVPGAALGIKVVCPVQPRAYSASFAHQPRMEKIQKDTWEGGGRFRSHLPSIVRVTVECPGYGKVSFSSRPGEQDVDPGSPTIPRGAPDTGDGSTVGQGGTGPSGAAPLLAGSLVFLGGSAVLVRRRALREQDVKENG
ncbi:hypothetical protein ACIBF1_09675 [Spirillospora sp. NPDC050679]